MNIYSPVTSPMRPAEITFAGLRFHVVTVDDVVNLVATRPADQPFDLLITPNAEHAWLRRKDAEFDRVSRNAWLSSNDSRVMRRAARLGGIDLGFAPGFHVVEKLFEQVISPEDAITIIGGEPDAIAEFRRRFGLTNVAHHNPPMGFIHDAAAVQVAVDFVATHPARFIFVAMGPPQSEKFCQRVMDDGQSTGLGLCIGSSINTIIDLTPRAPQWIEDRGLVWLYRLVREPRRLWKRYLVRGFYGLGLGAVDIVAHRLGLRRPS